MGEGPVRPARDKPIFIKRIEVNLEDRTQFGAHPAHAAGEDRFS